MPAEIRSRCVVTARPAGIVRNYLHVVTIERRHPDTSVSWCHGAADVILRNTINLYCHLLAFF